VHHDETFASLRVVTIAEDLDIVSLTQVLAWDLPLDSKLRAKVAKHANDTLLGTVSLVEKSEGAKRNSKKTADVLLRYNFPAIGLTDDALRTLILMVLATGGDVRRALVA
jgi:cation transport ATPase